MRNGQNDGLATANDEKHSARFVDQSGPQGIRDFPGWGAVHLSYALTIAEEGGKADIAKPMRGLGSGVFEIALPFRGDAFRVVDACSSVKTFGLSMSFRRNLRGASRQPS